MTIDFYEISASNEVPATLTEVGSSGPSGVAPKRTLIVAERLASGTVAANVPYLCTADTTGDAGSGIGSPTGEMVRAYKPIDPDAVLYAIGLDETASVAAAGSLGLSGTASASGELVFRVGGRRYAVAVASGDLAANLLTTLKSLVDGDTRRLATTSAIAASAIPLTARAKGPTGNSLDIRQEGTAIAGLTVTLGAFTGGLTAPSVTAAIAAVASEKYDTIVISGTDSTTMTAIEAEAIRRAQGGVEMPTIVFYGVSGSLGTLLSFSSTRNSKHTCPVPAHTSPTPPWIAAAIAAAVASKSAAQDPGRPYYGLELTGLLPQAISDRLEFSERQQLVVAGWSIWDVTADGTCFVERLVTAYKTDGAGQPDTKFRDVTTMRILSDWREQWRALTSGWRTYKLVDDDTPLNAGVRAITPSYGKAAQDALYERYAGTGNVQRVSDFIAKSRCERDTLGNPSGNRKRLNFYQPLRIGDVVITLAARIEVV